MKWESTITENDYVIRVRDDLEAIDANTWDDLLACQERPTPFMRHAYLSALHRSGSAVPASGWSARVITVERGPVLVGAVAMYLKSHSYGEYVFDWAWADAYRRHGLRYYPKLLGAVPFTPVPGTRLLATTDAVRDLLVDHMARMVDDAELSSAHVLFLDSADRATFERAGWLLREGVQFHWSSEPGTPWPDFESYLATLQRHKRKNIQQERRRVKEAGISFETFEGCAITVELWDFFYRCYTLTYQAHGSTPYLTRSFFEQMALRMPEHWLMFVASRGGEPLAASLVAIDRRSGQSWGRYWGCTEPVPCLHFEACYYQPLAWCIANGFVRFEGGAQGEHKMARGLLPAVTWSAHRLRDPRFASAVADFLARESEGVEAYVDELRDRSPFKPSGST